MILEEKTLDIVIPVYNEEACLPKLFGRLNDIINNHQELKITVLFVNDGSCDETQDLLNKYASTSPHIQVIHLSRNFGQQMAITAGLDYSTGDYCAIIDADLQDPPELIPQMLDVAQNNFDIVYGQRKARQGETWFKKITAEWFYKILSSLCYIRIPSNTGDFRLISKRVVQNLQSMRESHRFIRGLIPWIGFKSTPFYYDRDSRFAGTTKYPLKKMILLAIDAILSFSIRPLRVATYIGLGVVGLGGLGALFILYLRLFTPYTVPGITAVILLIFIMGGVQIILLGVIGEYVGRSFEASKDRPLYIIESTQNIEPH